MPPVYLVVRHYRDGVTETIRYLHSTPKTDADAECLAAELNDSLVRAGTCYEVMVE
jgi:hypothetical protein